ncbi:MAG: FGGY-family carbohydrate kinase, partial [Sedimentisphaerales bacterium]|nr:FGGY-family carbohydrate kinase [Sedimentisphaerales bacterium]
FLCGQKGVDITAAGSSALTDVNSRKWCPKIFKQFGIPIRMMPPLVEPGMLAGQLLPEVCRQTGLKTAAVAVVAGHDSLSAAAAIPIVDKDCAFLNCGTWSVLGIVSDKPVASEDACKRGFINELGLESVVFVKNMMGLYLFENLYRCLRQENPGLTYERMVADASKAKPFEVFLDIGAPIFFVSDDPRVSVEAFLRQTRQKVRPNSGQIIRAILESLAFSYKMALGNLEYLTGRQFGKISMAGGGIRNELLCRMTADATGCEVIAGPAEATLAGNIAAQAMAAGKLKNAAAIRLLILNSFTLKTYKPTATTVWDRNFDKYQKLMSFK